MVMTMKSSFRTQKEQYDIKRVKARTQRTEILYIFFGIHTANVVQLADRIEQMARLAAAWHWNLQSMRNSCGGTVSSPWKTDKKSGRNDRKQIWNWNFDELDAEIEGIGRCFAQIENIKRQSLTNQKKNESEKYGESLKG